MLSHIDPLFKTLFRKAEGTDARQEIKREETTYTGQDGQERKKKAFDEELYNDTAEVSIEGLITLLDDALEQDSQSGQEHAFSDMAQQMTSSFEDDPATEPIESSPASEKSGDSSNDEEKMMPPGAYQAASAYQNTAQKIEGREYAGRRAPSPEDTAHIVTMDTDDRKAIERLRESLRNLLRDGTSTLTMSRSGTFFESLSQAIEDHNQSV